MLNFHSSEYKVLKFITIKHAKIGCNNIHTPRHLYAHEWDFGAS